MFWIPLLFIRVVACDLFQATVLSPHICPVVPSLHEAMELPGAPCCPGSFLSLVSQSLQFGICDGQSVSHYQCESHEIHLVHKILASFSCFLSSLPPRPVPRPSYPTRTLGSTTTICASISCDCLVPPSYSVLWSFSPPCVAPCTQYRIWSSVTHRTHSSPNSVRNNFQREQLLSPFCTSGSCRSRRPHTAS